MKLKGFTMSYALAALSRNLIPILVCVILSACNGSYTAFESDVDFDVDVKTADIRQDNAELMLLAAYQSAFLGHAQSAAYKFLDASDLPSDADLPLDDTDKNFVPVSKDNQFKRICSDGGKALYSYTRSKNEAHNAGDRISIRYEKCVEGATEYNGSMTGTYARIKGLNDRFVEFTTDQCIAKLQGNLGISDFATDSYIYDSDQGYFIVNESDLVIYPGEELSLSGSKVVSIPGDDIRFERIGSKLRVDILSIETTSNTEGGFKTEINKDLSFLLSSDQNIVFVLRPKEPNENMVTSIDGDQFYSVVGLESKKENCQGFERTLSVNFNQFSTTKMGYITTALNGSVALLEAQNTANRVNQSFVNSHFTTTVTQGNSTEVYSMKDYNVEKAFNITNNTYSYEFNGLVNNAKLLGGQIALTTTGRLLGSFDSLYPSAGAFEIKAQGLERIYMVPDNLKIQLRVDYDGDSTGNGYTDFDIYIDTVWADLFAREFKE